MSLGKTSSRISEDTANQGNGFLKFLDVDKDDYIKDLVAEVSVNVLMFIGICAKTRFSVHGTLVQIMG